MNRMKFRRFTHRLFKRSLLLCAIISTAAVLSSITAQRREKILAERRRKSALTVVLCIFSTCIALGAAYAALHEIKHRRGGYLFDLFDRDEYDVVEPDEEERFEDIIRGELNGDDEDFSGSVICPENIPLDEEVTAENYRQ
ncbi:MAG: hypothetical protein MJ102_01825 [Clostridia bacterium]|nr:hypothetical protein [Clostridia bacterium]